MKNRSWVIGVLSVFAVFGSAWAEGEDTVTSKAYVDTVVGAKQDAIPAKTGSTNYAVLYPNTTVTGHTQAGQIQERAIVTNFQGDDATALVTAGAVKTALDSKQDAITGTAGNVLTFTGTEGQVTGTKVYNSAQAYTATDQSTALVTANQVNSAVTYGLNNFLTCAGWVDDDPTKDCILYQIAVPATVFQVGG